MKLSFIVGKNFKFINPVFSRGALLMMLFKKASKTCCSTFALCLLPKILTIGTTPKVLSKNLITLPPKDLSSANELILN